MSFKIFRHALLLLLRNWLPVIKISALPILALCVVFAAFFPRDLFNIVEMQTLESPGMLLINLLFLAFMSMVMLSEIAISWHRFILLQEQPEWISRFNLSLIFKYLWISFLRTMLITAIATIILVLLATFGLGGGTLGFGVIMLATSYFSLRISLSLPAIAVHKRLSLSESWHITRKINNQIVGLAFLISAFGSILSLFAGPFAGILYPFILGLSQWIQYIVGISVLTTLYGHLAEDRDLFE